MKKQWQEQWQEQQRSSPLVFRRVQESDNINGESVNKVQIPAFNYAFCLHWVE
jgi:hypothetical protein